MPQDSFTLKYIAKELKEIFTGGKISRINQPGKDVLSILIYTHSGTVKLTCDFSAKFCRLSTDEKIDMPNPDTAPNFCMLLRKHLQNAEVIAVGQIEGERVIYFDFRCFSEFEITDMRLYCEIMGKYSNAILVKDGIICGALKTASLENGARRVTLSGAAYTLPPSQDKIKQSDCEGIKQIFLHREEGDAVKFIADKIAGIAYTTAEDIVSLYGENVTGEQVVNYLTNGKFYPCLVYDGGKPHDFKARICEGAVPKNNILEAQREYYEYAVGEKNFCDLKRKLSTALSSAIKKVEKRLAMIHDKLTECEKADDLKLCGELIIANIYAIKQGADKFEAQNYYDENCAMKEIRLDRRLTPSQNATAYYKKYAKLKRTKANLTKQKSEEDSKYDYLSTIKSSIDCAETESDLAEIYDELISLSLLPAPKTKDKRKKPTVPFRTYSHDGFKVLCGRNNAQNDRLTKSLSPTDMWLHTKTYHSAHVAIVCEGKVPTDEVIMFAAEVCANYSDAKGNGKVPVDYTYKKYVKKPSGSAAGFVTYTDFKTILVAPNAHTEERNDGQQ